MKSLKNKSGKEASLKLDHLINQVERAVADLRRGQIVLVKKKKGASGLAILSPENIHPGIYQNLRELSGGEIYLSISQNRARLAGDKKTKQGSCRRIKLDKKLETQFIKEISGIDSSIKNLGSVIGKAALSINPLEIAAIKLAKIAELIPALILADLKDVKKIAKENDLLITDAENIAGYDDNYNDALTEVSNAPLKLENARQARIISFRPEKGSKEHHAIVIGKINKKKPVPVRIHSSCYTGDLLSSIRCDCRDQLHSAIGYFNEIKGGIVLYLMQEGRGIGIINKLRAYELQYEDGLDTVDANEFLGFEPDERPFNLASTILKKLGIKNIELMTNNPRKIKEMEDQGINVEGRIALCPKKHEYVREYLKTKSIRLKHMINL